MGLVKKKISELETEEHFSDLPRLLDALSKGNARDRRNAARDLHAFPESVELLCDHFGTEEDATVQHAIATTLIRLNSDAAVCGMMPYLRSEQASVRNAAVEVLQQMPEPVGGHISELLTDPNADVRIFAIDVLKVLCHQDAPLWLSELIETDPHINVCSTAVDCLAEIGTPEMIPGLLRLEARFPDEYFMKFAVQTAIGRIKGNQIKN
jgi:HEAT repeat protein